MKSLVELINENKEHIEDINEAKESSLTKEEIEKIQDVFGDKVELGKRGSVAVIDEEGVRKYTFGHKEEGYWIRGNFNKEKKQWYPTKGWQQYPLNNKNGNYTFESFDKMFAYFLAFWTKKHSS